LFNTASFLILNNLKLEIVQMSIKKSTNSGIFTQQWTNEEELLMQSTIWKNLKNIMLNKKKPETKSSIGWSHSHEMLESSRWWQKSDPCQWGPGRWTGKRQWLGGGTCSVFWYKYIPPDQKGHLTTEHFFACKI
jgi:hypothetical protein